MKDDLEEQVRKAVDGDRNALESVIFSIKDSVYNLSVKMLLFTEDAEDATQEILVKVVTQLSTFRSESKFTTWVYRLSYNYLLNTVGKRSRAFSMGFKDYEDFIDEGHSDEVNSTSNQGELKLLGEEVKISCTQGLLLCLDKKSRMIYILSDILEFNSREGAEILEISADDFRQNLSRSRKKLRNFLESKCGIANSKNLCRCRKKIDYLVEQQLIDKSALRFAKTSTDSIEMFHKLGKLEKDVAIFRSNPSMNTSQELNQELQKMLQAI